MSFLKSNVTFDVSESPSSSDHDSKHNDDDDNNVKTTTTTKAGLNNSKNIFDDSYDSASNSDSSDDDEEDDSGSNISENEDDLAAALANKLGGAAENPFQNLDFDQLMKRRERVKAAKENNTNGTSDNDVKTATKTTRNNSSDTLSTTILQERDITVGNSINSKGLKRGVSNNNSSSTQDNKNSQRVNTKSTDESVTKYDTIRPNIVIARIQKDGTAVTSKNTDGNKTRSFFGFGSSNNATSTADGQGENKEAEAIVIYEDAIIDLKPIDIGKRIVSVWPFDDYHLIQKTFYEKVRELGNDETLDQHILSRLLQENQKVKHYNMSNNNSTNDNGSNEYALKYNNYIHQRQDQCNTTIPIFSRPPDPVDISHQVYGLKLSSFEEQATERAIGVVSTWLFDVGLIDELLTNAGASGTIKNGAGGGGQVNASGGVNANGGGGVDHTNTGSGTNNISGGRSSGTPGRSNRRRTNTIDPSLNSSMRSLRSMDHNDDYDVLLSADELLVSKEEDIETKMDREIAKLRNSTKRALTLINSRLNDSVIAIGSEVSELVNAVVTTKDDIGRLRDLSSYVYNAGDGSMEQSSQQFMLTKYPKLKQAINARRNLSRVFRELDFFSQIPITCDRLREEMHAGEWTAQEWSSLRSVAREHVDLEIFLVEAEAGMKKRMEEEEAELAQAAARDKGGRAGAAGDPRRGTVNKSAPQFGRNGFGNLSSFPNSNNYALIDRFLEEHVKNVWEMGEEISIRIMNGIATAFDLAMTNPAGMVALVEAVEVYESANADYKAVHGEEAGKRNHKLQFTDMRAAALAELYRDFEARCLDVFNELIMQSADIAAKEDDEEASNKQFSAILRAANELGNEISVIKERMAPCFPDNWAITTLWTTCVAHVCSKNIMQQIGGPDGQNLPDLSMKQLLDLVAWVENFRQTINEIFPDLAKVTASKRSYLDKPPQLLNENSKMIDVALAEDSLVWVNNILWNIHSMAKDEFLFKTQEMAEVWLERCYSAEREVTQASDGKCRTAFSEDVYAMTSIHLRTIRERLTRQSEALVQAVGVVFKILFDKQSKGRDSFCVDFQSCCAAANDFLRMSDKFEEMVDEIKSECNLSSKATEVLDEQSAALLGIYSSDAVYASKKTQTFCLKVMDEEIAEDLFGLEWEEELTHNELAAAMVHTLDECMEDLEKCLDELMLSKAAEAQISVAVNFYISCLLKKGSAHSSKTSMFKNNELAIRRMRDDADLLRSYFNELAESGPTLTRIIEDEFAILDNIFDLLSIAAGLSKNDMKDSVIALQKRTKNVLITKFIVGDLWHIMNPTEERGIYDTIEGMEEFLAALVPKEEKSPSQPPDRNSVSELRFDQAVTKIVDEDSRKRPMKAEAIKKAEGALRGWGILSKKKSAEEKVTENAPAASDENEQQDVA